LKFKLKPLLKITFYKDIATLFSGTVIAQIISVFGALFLAKIYAPEMYGYYSVFLSFVGILTIINSLKFEYIVITEKSEEKSINTVNSLILIILLISIFHFVFFSVFQSYFLDKGIAFSLLIFSTITALFLSITKLFESFNTRKSLFKSIATGRVIMAIGVILFQFIFYFYSSKGLIYGYLVAVLITLFYFLFGLKKIINFPNIGLFKKTVKSHINIFKFAFPSGLINGIAIHIMPILMLGFFSASSSGIYALSLKIVAVPLFIISSSVSQVYFQKSSNYFNHSKQKLHKLTKNIVIYNVSIMLASLVLINTVGVYLLNLLFDNNWNNLSKYVMILSIFMLCKSSFSPISSIIIVTNKMHIGLVFNVSLVIINFFAIYIGYIYDNLIFTVLILSIIGGLGYVVLLFYFLSLLKSYKNES